MKTLFKKLISVVLVLTMVFSLSATAFAAEPMQTIVTDDSRSFTVLSSTETNYGTMYFVKENDKPQPRMLLDILDIAMAGASWSDLLKDPSWSNFGWAVLDTASLLPFLPSTAYVRKGGKVFLKADDFLKLAKIEKGKTAIKVALKPFKYSDGITKKAEKAIMKKFKKTEGKKVLELFKKAADKGFVGPVREAGIKEIKPSSKIGKKYTHEIKIKSSQYGDYRIFGYRANDGSWVFDLFAEGLH